MSDLLHIKLTVSALDESAAARHLSRIARMIERNPAAGEWQTSDIEGTASAKLAEVCSTCGGQGWIYNPARKLPMAMDCPDCGGEEASTP